MSDLADTSASFPPPIEARDVRVGLISDTHGRLDPRVHIAFEDAAVTRILHAGDIGTPALLWELGSIANVTAVLGNCDYSELQFELASCAFVEVNGRRILLVHDLGDLRPFPDDVDIIVHGHTHTPGVGERGTILLVNPGSASQCRKMPSCSVGILSIAADGTASVEIKLLDDIAPRSS